MKNPVLKSAAAAMAALSGLATAQAPQWPTRAVKFIVPFGPGAGADIGRGQALWEVITMLGVRVAGAVVPDVLRLFAALDTGVTARGLSGFAMAPVWGAFATDVGGGLEIGFGSDFTAGFFVDVRLTTRVPFEREPAFVGAAWSAGIAARTSGSFFHFRSWPAASAKRASSSNRRPT